MFVFANMQLWLMSHSETYTAEQQAEILSKLLEQGSGRLGVYASKVAETVLGAKGARAFFADVSLEPTHAELFGAQLSSEELVICVPIDPGTAGFGLTGFGAARPRVAVQASLSALPRERTSWCALVR